MSTTHRPATGTLVFRRATTADIAAVVDLVHSAYRGEGSRVGWTTEADLLDGQRTDSDDVASALADADRVVLLADVTGALVGCCQVERRRDGMAHFGMFAVRPEVQAGGVGRAILAEAERLAQGEWSAQTMDLSVIRQRHELISWYERRGYARTGVTEPFPYGNARFGVPRRDDLEFVLLEKVLGPTDVA